MNLCQLIWSFDARYSSAQAFSSKVRPFMDEYVALIFFVLATCLLLSASLLYDSKRRHGVHERAAIPARVLLRRLQRSAEAEDARAEYFFPLRGTLHRFRFVCHKSHESMRCCLGRVRSPYSYRSVERSARITPGDSAHIQRRFHGEGGVGNVWLYISSLENYVSNAPGMA